MNEVLHTRTRPDGRKIHVVRGDITQEEVDAVVNAANEMLRHGGGVAGAMVVEGGYDIQAESDRYVRDHGPVPTGSAAITGAGKLKARHVIHAVGPVWGMGNEEALLASAVKSALALADQYGLRSISLPAISTGIFGYPKPLAIPVILQTILQYLDEHRDSHLHDVRICDKGTATTILFADEARRLEAALGE